MSSWEDLVADGVYIRCEARMAPCESRSCMSAMKDFSDGNLDPAQAAELALLVELEARWENMRTASSRSAVAEATTEDLHGKQKAYEAFRTKLAGYNKRYAAAHVPELLLNTPSRLGIWCRAM